MKRRGIILLILLWIVANCAPVGPDYQRKDPAVPSRFGSVESGVTTGEAVGSEFLSSWWTILQDPILNSLMDRAVNGNLDLRIAQARVQQARALSLVSSSRLLPEGGLVGTYERVRLTEPASHGDRQNNLFLAGFDASWEIDIFGGVRRGIEAAEADLAASGDALRDILVTMQGEVARNYIGYRALQLRLEIARQTVQIRRENTEITEARTRAGFVSELDLTRARGELASAESRIPFLENSLLATLHRLGILLGLEPVSLAAELQAPTELPTLPENLPTGMPSDLLRRRPDIRRAERELAAATARIGVSTAELFPKFSLTGVFGFQADDLDKLPHNSSNFWSIGPTVRWPILNFKRILASIQFSKAVREETLALYERSVLLSLEEVENSLVNLSQEKRRIEALGEAVRSNELAVELARERYISGFQSYLAVIDAQSALYTAQDELAQSRQNLTLAFVALYKALGGGWLNTYGANDEEVY
jgi:NodT family efflux transporter outer membrane factor (OMF) lipoprotein